MVFSFPYFTISIIKSSKSKIFGIRFLFLVNSPWKRQTSFLNHIRWPRIRCPCINSWDAKFHIHVAHHIKIASTCCTTHLVHILPYIVHSTRARCCAENVTRCAFQMQYVRICLSINSCIIQCAQAVPNRAGTHFVHANNIYSEYMIVYPHSHTYSSLAPLNVRILRNQSKFIPALRMHACRCAIFAIDMCIYVENAE